LENFATARLSSLDEGGRSGRDKLDRRRPINWDSYRIKDTEAVLSISTRKLLWFEITKMLIAVS